MLGWLSVVQDGSSSWGEWLRWKIRGKSVIVNGHTEYELPEGYLGGWSYRQLDMEVWSSGARSRICPWHSQSVQFSSATQSCPTLCNPWTAAHQNSLSITNSWSLLKLMSIKSVMPSNHLILCRPILLPPSIFPSIRVFSNESILQIRWPKYWTFSFSISPSDEYSGLISIRWDWLDLPAVQGTLKSLLHHHSSKPSILWCSAFFIVQLSHLYMTTGKTIPLTRQTFVGKVMSLLFNMLSKFVIAFLPRSVFQFHGCSHHLQWCWSPPK